MPPDDLERGQLAKLHLVAQRAKIKQGSHVLEIGLVSDFYSTSLIAVH